MSRMSIPKRFRLLGIEYTVSIVAADDWHSIEACGLFDSARNHISVLEGPQDAIEQRIWHEIAHAILKAMGRSKLYADEAFVDLIASCIHQVITSQE